jgi:hypothetical protein
MNLGRIALNEKGAWKGKGAPLNGKRAGGQACGRTSKQERLTAAETPLAGQIMSSSPIRVGTPKAGGRPKSAQAGILTGELGPRGAGKDSGPTPVFKSRHKHLKYQLPEPRQEKRKPAAEIPAAVKRQISSTRKEFNYHIGFVGCLASVWLVSWNLCPRGDGFCGGFLV